MNKRKLLSLLLAVMMAASLMPVFALAAGEKVTVSTLKLTIDGKAADKFAAYDIDGEQYVKLRDAAYLLKDTPAKFSLGYANGAVTINTGAAYAVNGTECKASAGAYKQFSGLTNDKISVDGKAAGFKVYKIDGSNYVRVASLPGVVSPGGSTSKDVDVRTVPTEKTELLVHAAASLAKVLPLIADDFSKSYPNIKLTFNTGGSGALVTQITEGAGGDLFISADQANMDKVKGAIVADTRVDLLTNRIVLIVPAGNPKGITSFEDVIDKTGKNDVIAIGEEKAVPNGKYAREVYASLKLLDKLEAKTLTLDDSVTKVLSHVASGDAVAGFVYSTDAASEPKVTVIATAAEGLHTPVVYPGAVLSDSKQQAAANAFLAYLRTDIAKKHFEDFGFGVK